MALDKFGPSKTMADGLQVYCKRCRRTKKPRKGSRATEKATPAPDQPPKVDPLPEQLPPTGEWSPAAVDVLVAMLKRTQTRKVAAAWAGLHLEQLESMLERGRESPIGTEPRTIHDRVLAAEAYAEALLVDAMQGEVRADPRTALKLAERRFRRDWARDPGKDKEKDAPGELDAEELRNRIADKLTQLLAGSGVKAPSTEAPKPPEQPETAPAAVENVSPTQH